MADPLAVDPRYMPRFSDMNGSRDKASPFWGGLGAGVHQLLGLGGSALQGIANLEGADQVAALGRNFANDQNRIAARIRPDLDIAPWQEGGAHVLPWAEYQLGKLAPTLAGFVGATALAPEAAATTAIARGLPTFLGGAGAGATPEAAAAAGRFVLGGGAFGGGLGFGQAVQSADQQPGGATAADSVQALAESPLYAGASLLTPGFLKGALGKGGGNALTRIASKGLEGSAVGAFQSGSMTALDQTFRPDLTPKQKMDNIVDATVTGAAVAGLAGGLAGGLPGSRKIQRVDPNQLTVEHLDEATAAVDPKRSSVLSRHRPRWICGRHLRHSRLATSPTCCARARMTIWLPPINSVPRRPRISSVWRRKLLTIWVAYRKIIGSPRPTRKFVTTVDGQCRVAAP
jgi:hypothetical protein